MVTINNWCRLFLSWHTLNGLDDSVIVRLKEEWDADTTRGFTSQVLLSCEGRQDPVWGCSHSAARPSFQHVAQVDNERSLSILDERVDVHPLTVNVLCLQTATDIVGQQQCQTAVVAVNAAAQFSRLQVFFSYPWIVK